MKKIAIINLTEIYGGGEKFIEDAFFPIADKNEIHYLLRNQNLYNKCEQGRKLFLTGGKLAIIRQVNKYIREKQITSVIFNGNGAIYLIPFIKCIEKIAYKHTGWQSVQGIFKKIIYFLAINTSFLLSTKIISVSKCVKPLFIWNYKTKIIYNGVDLNKYKVSKNNDDIPVITFVGRIYKQKGIFELFEAVKHLSKSYSFKMQYIGEGPSFDELKIMISKDKLDDVISMIGFTSDVSSYLKMSDIFILPSYYEACPLSILEAMASGLPICAGNRGGANELVEHNVNGFLFNPLDVEDQIKYLEKLLVSFDLREQLGSKSRSIVENKFCLSKTISNIQKAIN